LQWCAFESTTRSTSMNWPTTQGTQHCPVHPQAGSTKLTALSSRHEPLTRPISKAKPSGSASHSISIAENQIDNRRISLQRTTRHRPREKLRHGHSENLRGDHAGRDGSRPRHQRPRRIRGNAGGGRVITIGSAVGERAVAPGLVPYAATKGAVKMFTQALSREVGSRSITVNNVQPGPIDTDLNPASGDWAVPQKAATALDRYGLVDEIAAMVAFVAGAGGLVHHGSESCR